MKRIKVLTLDELTLGKSRVDAREEAMVVVHENFTWIPPFSEIVVTDVVNTISNITRLNITVLDDAATTTRVNGTLSSIVADAPSKIPASLGMRLLNNQFVGNLVCGAINTALALWNFVQRKRRSAPRANIVKTTESNNTKNSRLHSRAWDATPHIRAGRALT
jgi:hypothetical protein